jgi:lipoate-protein ligase A
MAIDTYFARQCAEDSPPVFRFYGWEPCCLSLGYHQKDTLINFTKLERDGIDLVKRPTGGRAILHAEELTYSIVVPACMIHHHDLYQLTHLIMKQALTSLNYGVEILVTDESSPELRHRAEDFPCFTRSARTEVQFNKKKIIGSAQKIYPNAILQHGSILIGQQHKKLTDYLLVDSETRQYLTAELQAKTISLSEILDENITPKKLVAAILSQLEKNEDLSINFKEIDQQEMLAIEKNKDLFYQVLQISHE